jgi:hypothetical protein
MERHIKVRLAFILAIISAVFLTIVIMNPIPMEL